MAKSIEEVALLYLSHRERSEAEVREHLKGKEFSTEEVEEVLRYLKEFNYLNEERYCEAFLRMGTAKGRGPLRLKQELRMKGISSEVVEGQLADYFEGGQEKENALKEARKCLGKRETGLWAIEDEPQEEEVDEESCLVDEKLLAKAGRRLASLGYRNGIIYEVLEQLRRNG